MNKLLRVVWLGLVACVPLSVSYAEVTASSPSGFVSKHELFLPVAPARAYQALVQDVSQWWDASHSYSGDAAAFSMADVAGGCFCEVKGDVRVEHMRVVNVQQGKSITLQGGLGPLQSLAVQGSMTFQFEAAEQDGVAGTTLRYVYHVSGWRPGGLKDWAGPVDQVQLGQLLRLQKYLQTGEPLNP